MLQQTGAWRKDSGEVVSGGVASTLCYGETKGGEGQLQIGDVTVTISSTVFLQSLKEPRMHSLPHYHDRVELQYYNESINPSNYLQPTKAHLLLRRLQQLQNLGLLTTGNNLPTAPINNLEIPLASPLSPISSSLPSTIPRVRTHQGCLEGVLVHLEPPHRIGHTIRAAHDLRDLVGLDVPQDGLDLVLGGQLVGDVEVEGLARRRGGGGGRRRVRGADGGGLVGGLARVGGGLLEEVDEGGGRGGVGLVEEGDYVEGFALMEAGKRLAGV